MNKIIISLLAIAILNTSALAQETTLTANDRLALQIGRLTIAIENQQDLIIKLQDKIKELEAKQSEIKK